MTDAAPAIMWLRQDLRLSDNPALTAAAKAGSILPIYILDDENAGRRKMGAASRVWLHHSLRSLEKSLGAKIACFKGDAHAIILDLAKRHKARAVYFNRCYEPWRRSQDERIAHDLAEAGKDCDISNALLLWEPWEVLKKNGTPYKVFTPFYQRGLLGKREPRKALPPPKKMAFATHGDGNDVDGLGLLPQKPEPRWDEPMIRHWKVGEAAAQKALADFLGDGIDNYYANRNFPALDSTSHLSPRLHFGEISPVQIWHAVQRHKHLHGHEDQCGHFLREVIWREFNYNLLHHFPDLPFSDFQKKFEKFPWDKNNKALQAWQRGRTGYPIVDAAMRQLWQTGYMHNRCRLIVGSFLAKHLLLYWTEGEAWFWDCLFDADTANNICNWQWIAGTGADAAPYFRIFNPVMQGEKFDRNGDYVRRYVPEIAKLPNKYLHKPWLAPADVLKNAGVTLGKTYPQPIVDHDAARARALSALKQTR